MIRCWLMAFLFALPSVAQAVHEVYEVPSHAFWEKGNQVRLWTLAGLVAADGITTHHVLFAQGGRELNPLARPLVIRGVGGQLAASFVGYGLSLGTSYLFHKRAHHRMERLVLNLSIAAEVECVTNNLVQIAQGSDSRSGPPATRSGSPAGPAPSLPVARLAEQ